MQHSRRHAGWDGVAVAWLVLLTLALWGTGIAMHAFERDSVMELPRWQENLQRGATIAHGVLTWLFCTMAGRWIWPHASHVWRRRVRPLTWFLGIATASVGILLSLAGLGLLYGPGAWREVLAWSHWWLGLSWPALCAAHAWKRILQRR